MAPGDGPYARVYYTVVEDERFATVYHDDHAFAWWVRLLLIADGAWPASPPVPRAIKAPILDVLVRCGLIDMRPGDCYRIHGLDAERERRAKRAQYASNARWNAPSNASSIPSGSPSSNANGHPSPHALPSRDEPRRDRQEKAGARAALTNIKNILAET